MKGGGGGVSQHESLWRVRRHATPENVENVDGEIALLHCICSIFNFSL